MVSIVYSYSAPTPHIKRSSDGGSSLVQDCVPSENHFFSLIDLSATKMFCRQSFLLFVCCFLLLRVECAPQGFPVRGITNIDGAPEPYNYNYRVENPPTATFFGHNENGDAAGRVTGSYFVQLPDGRLMNVEYFVDGDSGFVPKITYQTGGQLVGRPLRI